MKRRAANQVSLTTISVTPTSKAAPCQSALLMSAMRSDSLNPTALMTLFVAALGGT